MMDGVGWVYVFASHRRLWFLIVVSDLFVILQELIYREKMEEFKRQYYWGNQ